MTSFDEIVSEIINSPLSSHLSSRNIALLAHKMGIARFQSGETIFQEHEPAEVIYYLIKGKVSVSKKSVDGLDTTLIVIQQGRMVGEMEVIDDVPRCATVRAVTNIVALSLTRHNLQQIINEQPRIGIAILKAMVRKLSWDLHRTAGIFSS